MNFELKAKEIRERLAKIAEIEQERFGRKKEDNISGSESDRSANPAGRKIDGEEKYEQIYSISSAFGKFD